VTFGRSKQLGVVGGRTGSAAIPSFPGRPRPSQGHCTGCGGCLHRPRGCTEVVYDAKRRHCLVALASVWSLLPAVQRHMVSSTTRSMRHVVTLKDADSSHKSANSKQSLTCELSLVHLLCLLIFRLEVRKTRVLVSRRYETLGLGLESSQSWFWSWKSQLSLFNRCVTLKLQCYIVCQTQTKRPFAIELNWIKLNVEVIYISLVICCINLLTRRHLSLRPFTFILC